MNPLLRRPFARSLVTAALGIAAWAWQCGARADINGDGKADLMWQDFGSGQISAWLLDGAATIGFPTLDWVCGLNKGCSTNWDPVGPAGSSRLLWFNPYSGLLSYWLLNGAYVTGNLQLALACPPDNGCSQNWQPVGTGTFHGGSDYAGADVLWNNSTTHLVSVWMVDGTSAEPMQFQYSCVNGPGCGVWKIIGASRHGAPRILWHNPSTGELVFWNLVDTPSVHPVPPGVYRRPYYTTVGSVSSPLSWTCGQTDNCASSWQPIGLDDIDGDGQDDVVWFNRQLGHVSAWLMNGTTVKQSLELTTRCDPKAGCTSSYSPIGVITGTAPPPDIK